MKKIILTLLTSCLLFTNNLVNLKAEEQTITKDYLVNTLGMDDEQIIAAGLAYVYEVGDIVTLNMETTQAIDAGRSSNNFTIPANTKWEMKFEVASSETDSFNCIQLVSVDALPIGLTSIDDGTHTASIKYSDMWINTFLNEKIYNMFDEGVKGYIENKDKYVIELKKTGDVINDIATAHTGAFKTTTTPLNLWIPSAKELGLGTDYTINQGSLSNEKLNTIGKVYANFKTNHKAYEVKYDDTNSAGYLLREDFHTADNTYFLCTNTQGLTHTDLTTNNKAVVFGMNIGWSLDTKDGVTIEEGETTEADSVPLTAYVPSSYAVDLPESVTLTNDFTQFDYVVSGDLEETMIVKVEFPKSATLEYSGELIKSDITLNVFNSKVTYDCNECAEDGTTGIVSIKNEIPSAGNWQGNLPVTISLSEFSY